MAYILFFFVYFHSTCHAEISKNIAALVRLHQIPINHSLLNLNYGETQVLKAFPKAIRDGKQLTYRVAGNKMTWVMDDQKRAVRVDFIFDLKGWRTGKIESGILESYRRELSPDKLANNADSSRVLQVVDKPSGAVLGVYFSPTSSMPMVRSITLKRKMM